MCLTEEIIEKARQWVLLVIILIVYNNCNFRGSSQFKENEKEVFGALKIVCFCFLWRKVYEETECMPIIVETHSTQTNLFQEESLSGKCILFT
jgi:hypothetical protein